jgi:ribosomal protein S18 acetylase RimI-like enzyme
VAERPQTPEIEIRELRIEDIPGVFALGERVFTADDSPTLYRTWDEYEVVNLFSSDGETCLVATIDDELVGFALGTIINKRNSAWSYGYLIWIAVEPGHAGKGIGRELLEALTEVFIELGARMLLVDTDAEKEDAIAFFERMGFGHPVEHVYMTMNLTTTKEYHRIRARTERRR